MYHNYSRKLRTFYYCISHIGGPLRLEFVSMSGTNHSTGHSPVINLQTIVRGKDSDLLYYEPVGLKSASRGIAMTGYVWSGARKVLVELTSLSAIARSHPKIVSTATHG
jgi:hypothetical protein